MPQQKQNGDEKGAKSSMLLKLTKMIERKTKDTEVGGTRILKGMVVRPSPLSPNYDPEVFPDPLRFEKETLAVLLAVGSEDAPHTLPEQELARHDLPAAKAVTADLPLDGARAVARGAWHSLLQTLRVTGTTETFQHERRATVPR